MANLLFDYLGIIVLLLILFLSAGYFLWQKKQKRRKSILILGLSNCGKTVLFSNLVYNEVKETFTSIIANIGFYKSNSVGIRIVDIPGNEKVRQKYFDQHKADARGIIYMIDSTVVQKDIRDIAEYLYVILTDVCIKLNCRHFLILCNKQDGSLAKGMSPIKDLLQKELDILRETKSKQLEIIDDSTASSVLGNIKKRFEFSQCKPLNVEFEESITYGETKDVIHLKGVLEWLSKFK